VPKQVFWCQTKPFDASTDWLQIHQLASVLRLFVGFNHQAGSITLSNILPTVGFND
jgi:hypothetical protein